MALAKSVFVDKCEVVSLGSTTYTPTKWKILQVRTATAVEEDGVELTRSFHRSVIEPGKVALGSTALTVTDVSGEDASVQAIFNAVMTDEIKEAFRLNSVGVRTANTITE
tara:strand:+ start:359 stop:688 length:330 start_codon:yes stop_codon:yes gene_type:complete